MALHIDPGHAGDRPASSVPGGAFSKSANPVTIAGEVGVLLRDASSVLTDAQEEAGFMRAGDRSLESRKPRAGVDSRAINLQLASVYLSSASGADMLEGGTADRFLDRLREREGRGRHGSRDNAQELARERLEASELDGVAVDELLNEVFPETAHERFALLLHTRERLREGGETAGAVYPAVEAALDRHSRESGPIVRAGFNADSRARRHADVDTRSGLISLYVEQVVQWTSMSAVYDGVVKLYGHERFEQAMAFLLGAAGDDMASIGPSAERPALESAVGSLHRLQTLVSMEESCELAIERLGRWLLDGADHHAMLGTVLRLHEDSWPMSSAVQGECKRFVGESLQASVAFHNQLCAVIEEIPAKAFNDERSRMQLIDIVHEARDEAVDREENESADDDASPGKAESVTGVSP